MQATALEALHYLRERVKVVEARESRHRPHWTERDLETVKRLLEHPAAIEQIALARIEGVATLAGGYNPEAFSRIRSLSRSALGLRNGSA